QRKQIDHNVLNAKLHAREADIVRDAGQPGVVTIATNMAGRGTDIKLGKGVKESGGLAIIGTERHDSRRVDRQLRGRAGRQGDPGSSQFYVSLEDDLMRMFGSERIAKVMDRLGLKEGEEIQHSMITSSIERAQKKVEENNFGIRKRLLEYDDVMNSQRDVIYKKRRHALFGERLSVDLANMIYDTLETIIAEYQDLRDPAGFRLELLTTLNADIRIDDKEFMGTQSTELTDKLFKTIYANYRNKQEMIAERAYPIIKNVVENHSHYENIAIPITDGRRTRNVVANLKKSYEFPKTEIPLAIEKSITLGYIDDAWKDHLRELDELKQSVQNASYEQKDPLLIYKFESFELFKNMIQKVNKNVASFLIKGNLPMADPSVKEAQRPKSLDKQQLKTQRNDLLSQSHSNTQQKEKTQPITVGKKIGRNDPCPCGSGKKYKNCHGREGAEPLN
ncbi:MAG: preprotein translocase subunit SecA, partial [Bacteroidia bacterium]|nr:SEC-C domain-containing protein [Bacteroidales bacterium]NCD42675.1 preprotein translocase subunit SecA [Bacteroidia bacterium]